MTAHRAIASKQEPLAEICRRFHVRRLAVFGSAARGDLDPDRSDVDMVVEFEPLSPGSYADNWFDLREALVELFGRPVDLVTDGAIRNPYFREAVERSQQTLYAA